MNSDFSPSKRLVLGTAQFGLNYGISNVKGQTSEEEVSRILEYAWEQGVYSIDTASAYGNCEEVLGRQMSRPFQIITKFPSDATLFSSLPESLNKSLEKLKVKEIYGLLAHHADSLIKNPALWEGMLSIKEKGLIRKIGYSLYTPEQLKKLIAMNMLPDIVQLPYNFFDRRFKPYFEDLKSYGTEIHARSVFLQGIFFMDPVHLPAFFDEVKALIKQLQIDTGDKKKLSNFLIQFASKEKDIDKLVLGVNNLDQLKENLSSLSSYATVDINVGKITENILMPSRWPKMYIV